MAGEAGLWGQAMTEDEAKQKWCPFVRVAVTRAVDQATGVISLTEVGNRDMQVGAIPKHAMCIGSACMAWRCGTRGAVKNRNDGSVRMLSPGDTYDPGAEIHFEAYDKTSGHCGLAGKT